MTASACLDDSSPAARPVALALEGAGSLGAVTGGVLDRLLDLPGRRIDVVSGIGALVLLAQKLRRPVLEGPLQVSFDRREVRCGLGRRHLPPFRHIRNMGRIVPQQFALDEWELRLHQLPP